MKSAEAALEEPTATLQEGENPEYLPAPTGISLSATPYLLLFCAGGALLLLPRRRKHT